VSRQITFTDSALRDLRKIPKGIQAQILAKIEKAAEDPQSAGEKRLKNTDGLYRVRQGDYRAVYSRTAAGLWVALIDHRRDVYARLRHLRR
jgi:mRNA interferase RelE/StbE